MKRIKDRVREERERMYLQMSEKTRNVRPRSAVFKGEPEAMKIICLECRREICEKFPFDDTRATHTVCRECIEQRLIDAGKEGLRRKVVKTIGRDT